MTLQAFAAGVSRFTGAISAPCDKTAPSILSGAMRLQPWVRKRVRIVFTISVMPRLKAAEIFFDE
jgi:hypothetical protein